MSKKAEKYHKKVGFKMCAPMDDEYTCAMKFAQAYADEQNRELKEMMLDLARQLKQLEK